MSPRPSYRERLLKGALECLRTKGYARTTTRDIAAASGGNLGSIGYHFGSKEALLNEAIRRGCAEWTEQLGRITFVEAGAAPLDRLRASWVALADTFVENRPLFVALIEAIAYAEHSEELRRDLALLYEESRGAIAAMVSEAIGEADLEPDQLRACSSFLIAVSEGLMLQWLASPEQAPSSEELTSGLTAALPAVLAAEGDRG